MKTTLQKFHGRILGVGAALLLPLLASAIGPVGPSGSFTNTVTDPANAVWDFSGIITNVDIDVTQHGTEAQASIPMNFTQSGNGHVSGEVDGVPVTLTLSGDHAGSVPITMTELTRGSIHSTARGAHLVFTVTATGTATLPGEPKASNITLKKQINAIINATNQTIAGTAKEAASASGVGSINETTSFTNTIAEVTGGAIDGSWTLVLDSLSTSNNVVSGTAFINLGPDQGYSYLVKGSFNSTKGTKLVLIGSGGISKGTTLQVTLDTDNVVRNIKGRVSGQNVNVSF